jgi:hypothetical protein
MRFSISFSSTTTSSPTITGDSTSAIQNGI